MKFQYISDLEVLGQIHDDILLIPILRDPKKHRKQTNISFIYCYNINTGQEYVLNHTHCDFEPTDHLSLLKKVFLGKVYVYNKSYVHKVFPDSLEINLLYWKEYNVPLETEYTDEIKLYHRWYYDMDNIHDIIPFMNWLIYLRNIRVQSTSLIDSIEVDEPYNFYNGLISNLFKIEDSGICTDKHITKKFIGHAESMLYTQYNIYTSTGRPSNHFNNINFAALNKSNGIRSMIIPRTDNGYLIEFDYDSFHVRLIANLIRHHLPEGNLHEYFGRFYFKTPVLDAKNYEKSKNLTWYLLYGNIGEEYLKIPFFNAIHEYKRKMWKRFKRDGFIEMPYSNRKIKHENFSEMYPNLLFNYLFQGVETEYNSLVLDQLLKYLYKKNSKLILYTYDSFLFDYDPADGKSFINDISTILNQNSMKTKISYGKNYHEMKHYDHA